MPPIIMCSAYSYTPTGLSYSGFVQRTRTAGFPGIVDYRGDRFIVIQSNSANTSGVGFSITNMDTTWPAPAGGVTIPNVTSRAAWDGNNTIIMNGNNNPNNNWYPGYVSTDRGTTWSSFNYPVGLQWLDAAYNNGVWLTVATDYSNTNSYGIYTSTNTTTWTNRTNAPGAVLFTYVAAGAGKFVAANERYKNSIRVSTDGTSWSAPTLPATTGGAVNCLRYLGNRFIVFVSANEVISSVDGVNWVSGSVSGSNSLQVYDIAYGNGKYIASLNSNKYLYSEDGINWTVGDTGSTQWTFIGVGYGNGEFVFFPNANNTSYWTHVG